MDKINIDRKIAEKADDFAEREYSYGAEEREYLSKGYYWGYKDARKDLGWHSVEESLPPIDEEVIALTDIIAENSVSIGLGRICFAHRPDPNGEDMKTPDGQIKHYDVVTYDGWNIEGVRYWMPMPKIPGK